MKNVSHSKKPVVRTGRGDIGKIIMAGIKDWPSKQPSVAVVERTDSVIGTRS